MPIPYELHTERLVIRCYQPDDAAALEEAIAQSRTHLVEWMSWAALSDPPESAAEKMERLRGFRHKFDGDLDYTMGIFERATNKLIGGTGLHKRVGPDAFEIGYWIHVDYCRKGFATENAAALTQAAFDFHEAKRVEIHCDPRNTASAGIPEKLGFQLEGVLKKRLPDGEAIYRDSMIWTMFADEQNISAHSLKLRPITAAFDFAGNKIS